MSPTKATNSEASSSATSMSNKHIGALLLLVPRAYKNAPEFAPAKNAKQKLAQTVQTVTTLYAIGSRLDASFGSGKSEEKDKKKKKATGPFIESISE
jgi:hypothetical protein